jgi:hypothetical protein
MTLTKLNKLLSCNRRTVMRVLITIAVAMLAIGCLSGCGDEEMAAETVNESGEDAETAARNDQSLEVAKDSLENLGGSNVDYGR